MPTKGVPRGMMKNLDSMAVAYVSLAVPDTLEFQNRALHYNTNIFMHNVLLGLRLIPTARVEAFSGIPVRSFPYSRRLFVPKRRVEILPGAFTTCVSFFNLTPLKQVTMGLSMVWHLLAWGFRMRQTENKIVFSFNISVPPLCFTLAAARLMRARTFVYICDVQVPGQTVPNSLLYRFDTWLETRLLKYVDGFAVISDRIMEDYAPNRPYLLVDGGVGRYLIETSGTLLSAREPDPLHFTIAASGSLNETNGFSEILQAFAQLKGPHYRLIIAGRGPLEGEIAVAAHRDARIDFRGFIPYQDLLALHATADVLVSMRITGKVDTVYAFPSKTFEYLVSGIPVITTATGHMKSEYGPYCSILDDETPESLVKALLSIESMPNSQRKRIGLLARKFMIEHKAWEVQHKRIADYVSAWSYGKSQSPTHKDVGSLDGVL